MILNSALTLILCFLAVNSAPLTDKNKLNIRLVGRALYDGTNFAGWQSQGEKQKGMRTVQDCLNKVVRSRFNRDDLHVTGSSRTDAGVHSRGQAFHLDLPTHICGPSNSSPEELKRLTGTSTPVEDGLDLSFLEYSLNRMLPNDLKVYNISYAPLVKPRRLTEEEGGGIVYETLAPAHKSWIDRGAASEELHFIRSDFHAIASPTGKLYKYRFCTNAFVDPTRSRFVSHFYQPMDLNLFRQALSLFVGTYDFAAFANQVSKTATALEGSSTPFSTIKTIHDITLVEEEGDPGYYCIDFHVESALYKMIRNIVGTCKMCAEGGGGSKAHRLIDIPFIAQMLAHDDVGSTKFSRADNLALSAPPEGLTLETVYFEHY